jgi:DNA-directed RNA polymerase subunit N (RpoN/RPB10)
MTAKLLRTFPVSAGLLDPQHVQAIGGALWVHLWFLNRVSRYDRRGEDDFVGIVSNGRPLSIRKIAEELGIEYYACRRRLARLVRNGYIVQKKTGAGTCTYSVARSHEVRA